MSEPIMQRLRAETRVQHVATEAIPFSSAILAGTLSREAYVGQLAAYLPLHRAIEAAVATTHHPAVSAVWTADMRRTPLLVADLAALGGAGASAHAARAEGQSMAAWITGLADRDPVAILGVVYVMEGSSLGGAVLRRHLATSFGLTAAGLTYYSPYGRHPKPHWVAFSDRMNRAITDDADADRIVAAAAETFDRIGRVLSALSDPLPVAAAV
jgi:heme oxygenase (biliverdin-IX-beta and delta-forming)